VRVVKYIVTGDCRWELQLYIVVSKLSVHSYSCLKLTENGCTCSVWRKQRNWCICQTDWAILLGCHWWVWKFLQVQSLVIP